MSAAQSPTTPAARLYVVDDEAKQVEALCRTLTLEGYDAKGFTSSVAALDSLSTHKVDVLLTDLMMPQLDGIGLIEAAHKLDPHLAAVVMTGHGTIDTAVRALQTGALDYIQKPIDLEELALIVARALGEARTREYAERLQRSQIGWTDEIMLLGHSPAMQPVHDFIERLSRFEGLSAAEHPTVLLLGETGTGKGLVARILHARSRLARQPFIALDCTVLPRELIEAELFGYERGAFTDAKSAKAGLLEVAAGGTLFLDEIAELSLDAQGKLLRIIEEKKVRRVGGLAETRVDVRIVAATNRDLTRLAPEDRFRRDLLYRLNVLTLTLPPLRQRGDDILLLADHYLGVYARKYGLSRKRLAPAAATALLADPWVGNVRELAHVIERAMLLVDGDTIEERHLSREARPLSDAGDAGADVPLPNTTLEAMERRLIRQALEQSSWNISLAARRLGVSREVLRYRMRKHAISAPGG